ncbi:hypothetical protein H5410_000985 [Solanum commersonii]|uniref:Cupin type-1 domain-containing protein n=1 Tax=Solanum commersonii TaxID=4109 RepID=A0A9J6AXT7_SOLCO|nr:hypothetical protein H5410_000985 [Solanum commersonii]
MNRKLNSSVPKWVFNLPNLVSLDLNYCNFTGPFPDGPVNLTSLTTFKASRNSFNCRLPKWLFDLNNLEHLELGASGIEDLEHLNLDGNHLEGTVSSLISNLSSIIYIYLSDNMLSGKLPNESVGQLSMLEDFSISNNRLEGVRWNIGPLFPMWLRTQKRIVNVDISDGGIHGEVPTWFWNLSSQIRFLNLSHNHFVGEVPIISTRRGPDGHERSLDNNGSYKLEILNLGGNDLSEEIPDCWMNWPELTVVILRDNNLIGSLPRSMEVLSNLAENEFIGKLPSWLGMRFPTLIVLILRSNKFDGELPQELCDLKDLQILDLANNTFVGIIPRCIGNLSAMVKEKKELEYDEDLNYSYYIGVLIESAMVTTKGNMYRMTPFWRCLQVWICLAITFGDIPISFSRKQALRTSTLGELPSSDGNIPNHKHEEMASDKDEVDWFYISMAIGFLSFWGVCGSLLFKRSWRHAYFRFLDRRLGNVACKVTSTSLAVLKFRGGESTRPHSPSCNELLFMIEGSLDVGLVDTTNKLYIYTQTLQIGDMFVFQKD